MNQNIEPLTKHIGKCVYCGSTKDLTDEHIVPRGLKGPWVLVQGSCTKCNKITSAFEKDVLRKQFILFRSVLGLPTYHPKKRPQSFSFEVEKDGKREIITLPTLDCPQLFMMLVLEKPRYIEEYDYSRGVVAKGWTLHGPKQKIVNEKFRGYENFSITTNFSGTCFARMLAKIAYGMVVLYNGIDALEECYVLPCILGQKDDAGYWVGNSGNPPSTLPIEKVDHRISLLKKGKESWVSIRLFPNYRTPEYLVIVGRLKSS